MTLLRPLDLPADEGFSLARLRIILIVIGVLLFALCLRLFYWQIIRGSQLRAAALSQYQRTVTTQGKRGSIYSADGYTLVTNEERYRLVAYPTQIKDPIESIAAQLAPYIWEAQFEEATASAQPIISTADLEIVKQKVIGQLHQPESKWTSLSLNLTEAQKDAIEALDLPGIGFEPYFQRAYPEASMAAHVLGFVGRNNEGQEVGYFGVEGALDKELRGREERQVLEADALGWQFVDGLGSSPAMVDGRDIVLTIRRDVQSLAEKQLSYALQRYGAKSGEILIMDPQTGKVLAMASLPGYDMNNYREFDPELYKNPSLSSLYEPGSTLKTLTVAAGIDAGVISPDTHCPDCDGPRVIGGYTLRTWNEVYNPDITMTDALAKSDNTAMIFVGEQLGADKLQSYLRNFGLGGETQVELQEDTSTPFPEKWGPVELATISFGQGISANTLQVTKAIAAIANKGTLMRPVIVSQVVDPVTQQTLVVEPQSERDVVSPDTAQQVTKMMVNAANEGEAKWTASRDHWVAGKTGTSQIAVNGTYDPDKTVASFIGFAPPDNPQFIMMVKLVEPTSSIWAAETAAPLWYRIADQLYILLNIPADKSISP